ncbi:hypothetical protein RhiLY_00907 [Ceratobasidium sp. AG-Ba]|nr:hypothetical protein RhiLY_00907 [Ceratobasidium sp. AG-Ba]
MDGEGNPSGTGAGLLNCARGGDSHNFEPDDASGASSTELEALQNLRAKNHGSTREAYVQSNDAASSGRAAGSASGKLPDLCYTPTGNAFPYRPRAHSMDSPLQHFCSPGAAAHRETAVGVHADDETAAEGVGSVNQDKDPRFDKTVAVEEPETTLASERDSMSSSSNFHHIAVGLPLSSPKSMAATMPGHASSLGFHDRGDQGADIEAPKASTLDHQRLRHWTNPRFDDSGASLPFHNQLKQMTPLPTGVDTSSKFETASHSSSIPNSSQLEQEIRPITPDSSNEALALASPSYETKQSSTTQASKKGSSPSCWSGGAIQVAIPTAHSVYAAIVPASSKLATFTRKLSSSPSREKTPRINPPEDRAIPSKVRRTGPSPFPLASFVSPLRGSRNGSQSYERPPAGGFSTPLRPSRIQQHTFSSPAIPTEPDVFTTPATKTAAHRLSAPPSSDPVFEVDNSSTSSTSFKLRPPRVRAGVTRPFKPPAKSARPTTATVQALKQRLQSLRNALRIRGIPDPTRLATGSAPSTKVMGDDELETLSLQWRNAAREAAQDLWALVKDSAGEDSWDSASKNSQENWGWDAKPQGEYQPKSIELELALDDAGDDPAFTPPDGNKLYQAMMKKLKQPYVPRSTMLPAREDPCDYTETHKTEAKSSDDEEGGSKVHTLGTMLTSLGIPHEVLGWQEEEGEFVD